MYKSMRTQKEIDALFDKAQDSIDKGKTKFRAMTYEEGIIETLRWLFGLSNDHPYEE